ncbi:MAG: hypothetical protein EOO11_10020 [Chitinophagaceae bacterium]|nr:MAG: hypothetical protein EOO11_10020 [Chitinophagaceae bacterium]
MELGEIEKTLMMHERVLSAVVAVHKNTLCAYIVLRDEHLGTNTNILFEELRVLCKENLTEYMVPHHWSIIMEVPLSSNGKVMRDKLPSPFTSSGQETSIGLASCGDVVAPLNERESAIRDIYSQLLRVPKEGICCKKQTFFQLGGNSLTAIQLLFALRGEFGHAISVQELFRSSTVSGVTQLMFPETSDIVDARRKEPIKGNEHWTVLELQESNAAATPVILFNPAGASGLW